MHVQTQTVAGRKYEAYLTKLLSLLHIQSTTKLTKLRVSHNYKLNQSRAWGEKKILLQFLNQLTFNCRAGQIVTSFSVGVSQGKINQKRN
jgi:hypothetical protein